MKKLLIIAVIFALVMGAAFAETSISGTAETRMQIHGDDAKDAAGDTNKPKIGGGVADAFVQLSGTNEEGTLGGVVRITQDAQAHRAFVWWKPIEQLRVFLGRDNDGMFNESHHMQAGWGFHRGGEGWLNQHSWDYWRAVFPQNWDTFGLALSVYPVEGLQFSFILPLKSGSNEMLLEDNFNSIRINASYAITDIGTIHLNYVGFEKTKAGWDAKTDAQKDLTATGIIGAAFQLQAVENLDLVLGFSTRIGAKSDANTPINIGLAGSFKVNDEFGIKFRGAFEATGILGYNWPNAAALMNTSTGNPWAYNNQSENTFLKGNAFQVNVMPYYVMEMIEIRFDFGIRMNMWDDNLGDMLPEMGWFINPYAIVPIESGKFQFGLYVHSARAGSGYNPASKDDFIVWSIPVGLVFSF